MFLLNALIGLGTAAFAGAVALPVRRPEFPERNNKVYLNKIKYRFYCADLGVLWTCMFSVNLSIVWFSSCFYGVILGTFWVSNLVCANNLDLGIV